MRLLANPEESGWRKGRAKPVKTGWKKEEMPKKPRNKTPRGSR